MASVLLCSPVEPDTENTMRITLWGTRGSVPVSGAPFVRHGGSTTCLSIDFDDTTAPRIVIDAGTGLAELGRAGGPWSNTLVLQTHLHWDHVQGFPFFGALFDPSANFDFWAVERDGETLRQVLDRQMSRPTFPVGLDILPSNLEFESIPLNGRRHRGAVDISWTELWHPSGSTGYRIEHDGCTFVFTGDVEAQQGCHDQLVELARGADVLVMDAQYFPDEYAGKEGWGHSTPADAVDVALAAGVARLVLTHHDPSHDDARLAQKLKLARSLAKGTGLLVDNAFDGMSIELSERGARAAA